MISDTGDVSHFCHYPLQINLGKTALRRQLAAAKCLWAGEMFLLKQTCSSLTYFSGRKVGEWVHTSKYQDAIEGGPPASNAHTTPGGKHNNKIQLLGLRRFLLLRQRLLCQHLLHSAAPRAACFLCAAGLHEKSCHPTPNGPIETCILKVQRLHFDTASFKCFNCKVDAILGSSGLNFFWHNLSCQDSLSSVI
jgi:hypothetical protein